MNENIFVYMFPGMMLMWVLFIAQNAMADIYGEQEKKTLQRMQTSPTTVNQIVISKILRCFLLCYISEGLLILFTTFVFGMSWGNLFFQILVMGAVNLAITGLLSLVYSLAKRKTQADAISLVVILFSSMLGGGMVPFEEMPVFMKAIGQWTINRMGAQGIQAIIRSEPLTKIVFPFLYSTVFGLISVMAGMHWFKRRLERGEA
ncbi:MAG: ABC transporter permease [Candidatus Omnitrophota bacterium]